MQDKNQILFHATSATAILALSALCVGSLLTASFFQALTPSADNSSLYGIRVGCTFFSTTALVVAGISGTTALALTTGNIAVAAGLIPL